MENKRKHSEYKGLSNEELHKKVALLESENETLETQNKEIASHYETKNKEIINRYEEQFKEAARQYDYLLEQILLSKRARFGARSEKTLIGQMSIFDEAELFSDFEEVEEDSKEEAKEKKTTRKPKSKKFSLDDSTLRVEQIVHDLSDEDKLGYKLMGQSSKKLLVFKPAEWYIEEHIYPKYVKELDDGSSDIISGDQVSAVFKGSSITSSALASILSDKYQYGLPLYRLESKFKSYGINLSRQTLSNWCVQSSNLYLDLLVNRMHLHLLNEGIIHADETTVKVLHHQDGSDNKKSYMWVYRSGVHNIRPLLIYDYQPNRKAENPIEFLNGFKGYLQTDGYAAYDLVPNITRVGCLAHARRKFVETKDISDKSSFSYKYSTEIIKQMNYIFKLEKQKKILESNDFDTLRETEIKDALESLKTMLLKYSDEALPKSNFGKAIQYALNQFDSFEVVLKDSRLEFSNNAAERAIKPFVMGRKAWLFSNTTKGAKSSAAIYSVVQSAKENGLHIERYLTYVFDEMKGKTVNQEDQFDYLLPNSESLPEFVYQNKKRKS